MVWCCYSRIGKLASPTMGHAISKNCYERETSAFNKTENASIRMRRNEAR